MRYTIVISLLILIAQTTKAQYTLAVKNDRVKYDSAVVVRLDQYRKESYKLNIADSLINNYRSAINKLEKINNNYQMQINSYDAVIHAKDGQIDNLSDTNERLLDEYKKAVRTKWFEQPYLYGIVGIILGGLLL